MATDKFSVTWVSLEDEETPPPVTYTGKTKHAPLPAHQIPSNNHETGANSHEESELDRTQPVFVAGREAEREVVVIDDSAPVSEVSVHPQSVSPLDTGNAVVRADRVISVDRDDPTAAEVVVIADSESDTSDGPAPVSAPAPAPASPTGSVNKDDNAGIPVIEGEQEQDREVNQAANRKRKEAVYSGSQGELEDESEGGDGIRDTLTQNGSKGRRGQGQTKRQKTDGKCAGAGQRQVQKEAQTTRNGGKRKRVGLLLDHIRDPGPENPMVQDILKTGLSWTSTGRPRE